MPTNVTTLRDVARWSEWLDEDLWYPSIGDTPTAAHVLELWTLVNAWGVEDPRDLPVAGPKAAQAWRAWQRKAYGLVRYAPKEG
jgi:hypothetical protein